MKHTYQIEGIGCAGCVQRVRKTLEEHPAIESANIYLSPKGRTVINMKENLSVWDLQAQLDKLGAYRIQEAV